MCRSMVDIQSPTAEIRRGKKRRRRRRKKGWKYNGLPYYIGQTINMVAVTKFGAKKGPRY